MLHVRRMVRDKAGKEEFCFMIPIAELSRNVAAPAAESFRNLRWDNSSIFF